MCPSQRLLKRPYTCLETIIFTQGKLTLKDFYPCKFIQQVLFFIMGRRSLDILKSLMAMHVCLVAC